MKTLWHRFTAPTPAFWRKVRNRSAAAAASLAVLIGTGYVPEALDAWLKYLFVALSVVSSLSQFTCTDASSPDQQTQEG